MRIGYSLFILFLTGIVTGLPGKYSAQVLDNAVLSQQVQPIVQQIFDLQHRDADNALAALKPSYPNDPAIPLLQALNRFWQTELSWKDPRFYDYIIDHLDEAVEKNEAFEDQSRFAKSYEFVAFMSHAVAARLYYFRESDWRSVNEARKIIYHLEPAIELAAGSPELSLVAGLYHYYSISYPRDKSYLRPFMAFFPDGDIAKGLKELEYAANTSNIGQAQSLYYLTDIYLMEYGQVIDALRTSQQLHELFPHNTLFHADYIRVLVHGKRFSQAKQECDAIRQVFEAKSGADSRVITSSETRYTSQVMIRIYHYLGQIAYHGNGNAALAKDWLLKSQQMSTFAGMERDKYTANNYFYLGLCEDKLGNRSAALTYYELAQDHPEGHSITQDVEECEGSPCTTYSLDE
ncbi:MAG: hypothetical protein NWR72_14275 [Bacteroidia bacterium]|nr:hypothetical protein [Bacteroidia bacterium]